MTARFAWKDGGIMPSYFDMNPAKATQNFMRAPIVNMRPNRS